MSEVVYTVKAGPGYDDSWAVFHGDTVADADALLKEFLATDGPEKLAHVTRVTQAAFRLGAVAGSAPAARTEAPAATPAPASNVVQGGWGSGPQGEARSGDVTTKQCPQCGMAAVHRSGTSKAGKPYNLTACPNQKTRGDGHLLVFGN